MTVGFLSLSEYKIMLLYVFADLVSSSLQGLKPCCDMFKVSLLPISGFFLLRTDFGCGKNVIKKCHTSRSNCLGNATTTDGKSSCDSDTL